MHSSPWQATGHTAKIFVNKIILSEAIAKVTLVSVKDVAKVFVSALENQRAERKVYEIRDPAVFTFAEIARHTGVSTSGIARAIEKVVK